MTSEGSTVVDGAMMGALPVEFSIDNARDGQFFEEDFDVAGGESCIEHGGIVGKYRWGLLFYEVVGVYVACVGVGVGGDTVEIEQIFVDVRAFGMDNKREIENFDFPGFEVEEFECFRFEVDAESVVQEIFDYGIFGAAVEDEAVTFFVDADGCHGFAD